MLLISLFILSTVWKAARLAMKELMMMRMKRYQHPLRRRRDWDLKRKKYSRSFKLIIHHNFSRIQSGKLKFPIFLFDTYVFTSLNKLKKRHVFFVALLENCECFTFLYSRITSALCTKGSRKKVFFLGSENGTFFNIFVIFGRGKKSS